LASLARNRPKPVFGESYHWVNHLLFNPDGSRFIFLHRWSRPKHGRGTRLYTADPDGSRLRLLLDHELVSHFTWRDRETILVWARHPSRGDRYYLVEEKTGRVKVLGEDVLTQDGHMSYSPDRKWILTDTYPDRRRMRLLILYRVADGRRFDIGRFFSPQALRGPARCDLHPRWSCDGMQVCIDSAHEKTRQVYVLDVGRFTR
jgi:dipeptidyl aminopeptidase/acylaminoacyl peptidase